MYLNNPPTEPTPVPLLGWVGLQNVFASSGTVAGRYGLAWSGDVGAGVGVMGAVSSSCSLQGGQCQ